MVKYYQNHTERQCIIMLYDKEIDDKILIQLIILYALKEAERPLTLKQLETLVLDNCNINYVNFKLALDNLINVNQVRTFLDSNETRIFEILSLGMEAIEGFGRKIPVYIRDPIRKSVIPMFREEMLKNSVRATLMPLNEREYAAQLGIYEANVPLMELTFYAGSRAQANSIMRNFKNNSDSIYEGIVKLLNPETYTSEDGK